MDVVENKKHDKDKFFYSAIWNKVGSGSGHQNLVGSSRFEIHLNLNFSCSIYWSHDNTVRKYHIYWLLTEEKSKRSILLGKNKAEFGFSRRSNPDPGKALPAPQPCLLVTPTESKTLKASLISSSALISSNLRAIIPRKLGNCISFQLLWFVSFYFEFRTRINFAV